MMRDPCIWKLAKSQSEICRAVMPIQYTFSGKQSSCAHTRLCTTSSLFPTYLVPEGREIRHLDVAAQEGRLQLVAEDDVEGVGQLVRLHPDQALGQNNILSPVEVLCGLGLVQLCCKGMEERRESRWRGGLDRVFEIVLSHTCASLNFIHPPCTHLGKRLLQLWQQELGKRPALADHSLPEQALRLVHRHASSLGPRREEEGW